MFGVTYSKLAIYNQQATWNPDSMILGANMGPIWGRQAGPRCAPCWPHELCYLGCKLLVDVLSTSLHICILNVSNHTCAGICCIQTLLLWRVATSPVAYGYSKTQSPANDEIDDDDDNDDLAGTSTMVIANIMIIWLWLTEGIWCDLMLDSDNFDISCINVITGTSHVHSGLPNHQ